MRKHKRNTRNKRQCKWCGQLFRPRTNHQLYHTKQCAKLARQDRNMDDVREHRKKFPKHTKYTLGSGSNTLKSHAQKDKTKEQITVQDEYLRIFKMRKYKFKKVTADNN